MYGHLAILAPHTCCCCWWCFTVESFIGGVFIILWNDRRGGVILGGGKRDREIFMPIMGITGDDHHNDRA